MQTMTLEEYKAQQKKKQELPTHEIDMDDYKYRGETADMVQAGKDAWTREYGKAPAQGEATWGESLQEAGLGVGAAVGTGVGAAMQTAGDVISMVTPDSVTFDDDLVQSGRELSALGSGYNERVKEAGTYHNRLFPKAVGAAGDTLGFESLSDFGKTSDIGTEFGSPAYRGTTAGEVLAMPGAIGKGKKLMSRVASYAGAGGLAGYGESRGSGEDKTQASFEGAIGAAAGGAFGVAADKLASWLSPLKLTPDQIRDFDSLPSKIRGKFEQLAADTSSSVEEYVNRVADFAETTSHQLRPEDLMRVAAATGDPRANKYLAKGIGDASKGVGNVVGEASERTNQIRQAVEGEFAEVLEDFTKEIDGKPYTDWTRLSEAVDDLQAGGNLQGVPSEVIDRIKGYSRLDDVSMAKSALGQAVKSDNPYYLESTRSGFGAQKEAAAVEVAQRLAQSLGFGGPRVQIINDIVKSVERGQLAPAEFIGKLKEQGVPVEEAAKAAREIEDIVPEAEPQKLWKDDSPTWQEHMNNQEPMPNRTIPGEITEVEPAVKSELDEVIKARSRRGDDKPLDFIQASSKEELSARAVSKFDSDPIIESSSKWGGKEGLDDALAKFKTKNEFHSDPTVGGGAVGATAGIEENEDGSYSYDFEKGLAGAAAGATVGSKTMRKHIADKVGKAFEGSVLDAKANILPTNSREYKALRGPAEETGEALGKKKEELAAKGYSDYDVEQAVQNIHQGDRYSYISKGLEAAKQLPKGSLPAKDVADVFKSRYKISEEELKHSGFNDWLSNKGSSKVSRDDVLEWWETNAGKELPTDSLDTFGRYTAKDLMPDEADDTYDVAFKNFPNVNKNASAAKEAEATIKVKEATSKFLDDTTTRDPLFVRKDRLPIKQLKGEPTSENWQKLRGRLDTKRQLFGYEPQRTTEFALSYTLENFLHKIAREEHARNYPALQERLTKQATELKAELPGSTDEQRVLIGAKMEEMSEELNQEVPRVSDQLYEATLAEDTANELRSIYAETRTIDYDKTAAAQIDEMWSDVQKNTEYNSDHQRNTEPMYSRSSIRETEDGTSQLVVHEFQSDAFAAGDSHGLKKHDRMPFTKDWQDKVIEDTFMKAMDNDVDEIVIPVALANSDTDVYMFPNAINDSLHKGNKAGWSDEFMISKAGKSFKKQLKKPQQALFKELPIEGPADHTMRYPENKSYREGGGRRSKGALSKSNSTTTPLYYGDVITNKLESVSKRLGIPKEAISYETVGDTHVLKIDINSLKDNKPTFSIYGKPGEMGKAHDTAADTQIKALF